MNEDLHITPRKGKNGCPLSFEELLEMELQKAGGAFNTEENSPVDNDTSIMTDASNIDDILVADRKVYLSKGMEKLKNLESEIQKFTLLELNDGVFQSTNEHNKSSENFNIAEDEYGFDEPSYMLHDVSDTVEEPEVHLNRDEKKVDPFQISDFESSLVENSIVFEHLDKSKQVVKTAKEKPIEKFLKSSLHEEKKVLVPKDSVIEKKLPEKSEPEHKTQHDPNIEAVKYREMNAQLIVLRDNHEKAVKAFQKEKKEFEAYKQSQITSFQKMMEEERKKFESEKKKSQKQQGLLNLLPNKNERFETETLRKKINQLEDDIRSKDLKHKLNMDRLKKRIDDLTSKNHELNCEVEKLEKDRISLLEQQENKKDYAPPLPLKQQKVFKQSLVSKPHREKENFSVSLNSNSSKKPTIYSQQSHPDGRMDYLYTDGTRVTKFNNGSVRELRPDGIIQTLYLNGDQKLKYPDGKMEYYFADTGIKQTKLQDGTTIHQFRDGQVETQRMDGTKEIMYKDGTKRFLFRTGEEECIFPDGTMSRIDTEGRKVVEFSDGSREVYWKQVKQRFETDGTVRTVYADGTRETKYPDGNIKRIDTEGKLVKFIDNDGHGGVLAQVNGSK